MFTRVRRLTPKQKGEILAAWDGNFELIKRLDGYSLGHYDNGIAIFVLVRCQCGHIFAMRPDAAFASCLSCKEFDSLEGRGK